jgi:hypothetical protein
MSFFCNLCSNKFTQKKNLNKHLGEKRCKSDLTDLIKLNSYISELKLKIKAIDQVYINNPNNLQVFMNNQHFNFDQINYSKQLLAHFGGKTDVFYMFLFVYCGKYYLKFGIVNIRKFFDRFKEHLLEFGDNLCILEMFQSHDVTKIESEHKNSTFFKQHKTTIPKKHGGNHIEIYQLTETLTFPMIKTEILKTAGNRITDSQSYNQVIESSELTKREEELTK